MVGPELRVQGADEGGFPAQLHPEACIDLTVTPLFLELLHSRVVHQYALTGTDVLEVSLPQVVTCQHVDERLIG